MHLLTRSHASANLSPLFRQTTRRRAMEKLRDDAADVGARIIADTQ